MRRFAAPIAVVTVVADERELGVTVGSFGSLSLEPALAGVSIGLGSPLHEPLRQLGRFSASLLAGDQGAVAQHFARGVPPIALWSGVARHPSEVPEPLLEGALAWLACRVEHECEAGLISCEQARGEAPGLAQGLVERRASADRDADERRLERE